MFDENSNVMAMVGNIMNVKDSRWLQLEVCREYQRGQCSRTENECKFAHPPPHVEVQNGRVTACYDSIKGRCQRENPKCKYLHPPQHLKDQLLINGKNNLALKNMLMTQINPLAQPAAQFVSPLAMAPGGNAYAAIPGMTAAYPYGYALAANSGLYHGLVAAASPESLQAVPPQTMKRPALDKSGIPVYQPASGAGTVTGNPGLSLPSPVQYAQLAGVPGLQASYLPTAAVSSLYQYPWYSTPDEQKVAGHPSNMTRF